MEDKVVNLNMSCMSDIKKLSSNEKFVDENIKKFTNKDGLINPYIGRQTLPKGKYPEGAWRLTRGKRNPRVPSFRNLKACPELYDEKGSNLRNSEQESLPPSSIKRKVDQTLKHQTLKKKTNENDSTKRDKELNLSSSTYQSKSCTSLENQSSSPDSIEHRNVRNLDKFTENNDFGRVETMKNTYMDNSRVSDNRSFFNNKSFANKRVTQNLENSEYSVTDTIDNNSIMLLMSKKGTRGRNFQTLRPGSSLNVKVNNNRIVKQNLNITVDSTGSNNRSKLLFYNKTSSISLESKFQDNTQ